MPHSTISSEGVHARMASRSGLEWLSESNRHGRV
jgi:hypothetical protein